MKRPKTQLFRLLEDGLAQCLACAHKCKLSKNQRGICAQRSFDGDVIDFPWESISGMALDPMEKKPLYHFLPGDEIMSIGSVGCNLSCRFCQNWQISQVGKDAAAISITEHLDTEKLIELTHRNGTRAIAFTYNEPLISPEWCSEIFRLAHAKAIKSVIVSNGFASEEALCLLMPHLDAANIDLKCGTDAHYKWLGGRLNPVIETIRTLHANGIWVEVTTLVVPGFNDSDNELETIASLIAGISPDIPWHISAFFSTYKMPSSPAFTPAETLAKAAAIGKKAGINFIYTGNMRGKEALEDTICPHCQRTLIRREGFNVVQNLITDSRCPFCKTVISGVF